MIGLGRHEGLPARSGKTVIALIVLAKLLLIVGALVLLSLGAGYLGAGTWVLVLHGVVLAAIMAFAFVGGARRNVLFGSGKHRAGDHSRGIVLHGAARYDLLARLLTFGREGRFRQLMLRPAKLQPGESWRPTTRFCSMSAKATMGCQAGSRMTNCSTWSCRDLRHLSTLRNGACSMSL